MRKRVSYFLALADNFDNIKLPKDSGGLDDVKWFPISEISEIKMYPDVRPIIDKGIEILKKNGKLREANKL